MSWNDFHHRRAIMDAVLDAARARADDSGSVLEIDAYDGARQLFGTETALLQALHHRWSQLLGGYLRTELCGRRANDLADATARAWHTARSTHSTLRSVIDTNLEQCPELLAMHEADMRMLALAAGLGEKDEPTQELTRIGSAFVGLLDEGADAPHARRRDPVGRLLRMLAPSA